ncbi:hypothetical protein Misp06_02941 [Microbulbifer sp. NBRC 101763]
MTPPKNEESSRLGDEEIKLNAGFLGKLFGDKNNAPSNIAGCILLLLIGMSIYGTLFELKGVDSSELWKFTVPVINLILGYLFGKG